MSDDDIDLNYPQIKGVAEYCKKHDASWKSLDNQDIQQKSIEILNKDELLQRHAEIRN